MRLSLLASFALLCACLPPSPVPADASVPPDSSASPDASSCAFEANVLLVDGQDWFELENDALLGGGCVRAGQRVWVERDGELSLWGTVSAISGDVVLMSAPSELDGWFWLVGGP